jgi:hypothetical protein
MCDEDPWRADDAHFNSDEMQELDRLRARVEELEAEVIRLTLLQPRRRAKYGLW